MSQDENLKKYKSLPRPLKDQVSYLLKKFGTDSRIVKDAKLFMKDGVQDPKVAKKLAILKNFDTYDLIHKRFFDGIYAYDEKGRTVTFKKILTDTRPIEHVCLFKGRLHNPIEKKDLDVIVKWYESPRHGTVQDEIENYQALRDLGCKVPWFSSSYLFWKSEVLIMEPLNEVTGDDDEFEVVAQVVQQLKLIHKIGIHNDLKPPNIMWRPYGDRPKGADRGDREYLVIDYGGMTTEKYEWGWYRKVWSPKWCAQERKPKKKKDRITSPYYDLLEAVYMAKSIQNHRKTKDWGSDRPKAKKPHIRSGFKGKLKTLHDAVLEMDPKKITEKDYDTMIKICRDSKSDKVISSAQVAKPTKDTETLYSIMG